MKEYIEKKEKLTFVEEWVKKLMEQVFIDHISLIVQYPTDCGVFAPYLLNTITMNPGDSIYMGADMPHAYLHGFRINVDCNLQVKLWKVWLVVIMQFVLV